MSEEAKNGLVLTDFGGDIVDKARLLFGDFPARVDSVVRPAIKRTATMVRNETSRAIRERYDISAENLRSEENVQMHHTIGNNVFYAYIHYRSYKGIPLFRFNGVTPKYPKKDTSDTTAAVIAGYGNKAKWRMVNPGVEASVHVLKGNSNKKLEDTFVAIMKSGHTGIFKRTGGVTGGIYGGSDEIKELYGPNIVQMLGNKAVQDKITKKAETYFVDRMEHEIQRLLDDERWADLNK